MKVYLNHEGEEVNGLPIDACCAADKEMRHPFDMEHCPFALFSDNDEFCNCECQHFMRIAKSGVNILSKEGMRYEI